MSLLNLQEKLLYLHNKQKNRAESHMFAFSVFGKLTSSKSLSQTLQ